MYYQMIKLGDGREVGVSIYLTYERLNVIKIEMSLIISSRYVELCNNVKLNFQHLSDCKVTLQSNNESFEYISKKFDIKFGEMVDFNDNPKSLILYEFVNCVEYPKLYLNECGRCFGSNEFNSSHYPLSFTSQSNFTKSLNFKDDKELLDEIMKILSNYKNAVDKDKIIRDRLNKKGVK